MKEIQSLYSESHKNCKSTTKILRSKQMKKHSMSWIIRDFFPGPAWVYSLMAASEGNHWSNNCCWKLPDLWTSCYAPVGNEYSPWVGHGSCPNGTLFWPWAHFGDELFGWLILNYRTLGVTPHTVLNEVEFLIVETAWKAPTQPPSQPSRGSWILKNTPSSSAHLRLLSKPFLFITPCMAHQ